MDDKLDPAREFINRVRASTLRESVTCKGAEREETLIILMYYIHQYGTKDLMWSSSRIKTSRTSPE